MDFQALADLLFPNVTDTPEMLEERFPLRNAPEGAVITRMAPSPTGFVHLGKKTDKAAAFSVFSGYNSYTSGQTSRILSRKASRSSIAAGF